MQQGSDHALRLDSGLQGRLEAQGLAFLAGILEIEVERYPENMDALAELGHVYTRQGRHREGLAVDLRLAVLLPDNPTVHYNLACSQALLGHTSDALDSLEHAVELGYDDASFLALDDDLASLREETRFRALVALIETQGGD